VKTPRVLVTLLLAGALAGTTALPAAAAIDFNPIVPVAPDGGYPQISVDPATGNGLVVWQGQDNDSVIYGQIVNPELGVVLPPVAISTDGAQVEFSQPYAAWNEDESNWLVVWDNDTEVWGRVFDASGPIGSPTLLADHWVDDATVTFDDIEQVEAAWNPTGQAYLVGFKAESLPSGCQEIFGVLVDEDGVSYSAQGAAVLSSDDPGPDGDAEDCELEADNGLGLDFAPTTNDWLVTWYSEFDDVEVGRFINVSFLVPGHASSVLEFGPNTGGGAGSVRYDPVNDQFLVAWHTETPGQTELRGVWVQTDYTVGSSFAISDDTRQVRRPRLDYDASTGNFNVVAHAGGEGAADVYLWELPAGSTTLIANPQLVSTAGAASTRPVVASYNACVMVLWQERVEGGEAEDDVYTVLGRSTCASLPATGGDASSTMLLLGGAGIALALGLAATGFVRSRKTA
jgi:LPXTG-motif cell wall-anchored protein